MHVNSKQMHYQGKVIGAIEQVKKAGGDRWTVRPAWNCPLSTYLTWEDAVGALYVEYGMHQFIDNAALARRNAIALAQEVESICKRSPIHLTELRIALAWIWEPEKDGSEEAQG